MAVFNPQIPNTNDPNYLNYAKPISPWLFQGDKTAGLALSGLGDIFKESVTGADEIVKNTIDKALYENVDKQREGYTGALEEVAGIPDPQRVGDIQPDRTSTDPNSPYPPLRQNQPLNILGDNNTSPPAGVDAGLSGASSANAGFNNGKLSPLHYVASLDTIAKSLRSDYPGYRDYIDTKIASITGMNPANEYYKELLTGINASLTNSKSELEKAKAYVAKNDQYPGAAQIIQDLDHVSNPMAYAVQWGSRYASIEYGFKMRKASFDDFKADRENLQLRAKDDLTKVTSDEMVAGFNTFDNSIKLHLTSGGKTTNVQGASLSDLSTLVDRIQKGELKPTEEETQAVYGAYMALRNNIFNRAWAKANLPGPNGSYVQAVGGPEAAKAIINSQLAGIDSTADLIGNKDYGAALRVQRANKAIHDDSVNNLYNAANIDVQTFARTMGTISSEMGPQAASLYFQGKGVQALSKYQTLVENEKAKMAAQSDLNTTGQVYPLKQALDNFRGLGIGTVAPNVPRNPNDPSTDPNSNLKKNERKLYEDLIDVPGKMVDPNMSDASKIKIALAAFSPANRGIVREFANDQIVSDPNTVTTVPGLGTVQGSKIIPGSHMVFSRMTTPAIANEIYRLGQMRPELITMYNNWVANEHRSLFQSDIQDLNELSGQRVVNHLAWNDGGGKSAPGWVAVFNTPKSIEDAAKRNYVNQKLALVNQSIQPLYDIAKRNGKDTSAYIFQTLLGEGVDPNATGIPSQMLNAVLSAKPGNTGTTKTPQQPKENNDAGNEDFIRGTANKAHTGSLWGNPLDTENFTKNHLTTINAPSGQSVTVNKVAAQAFQGFLSDLENEGYKINSIGGYNLRTNKSDPRMLSQHAFGNAIDINPERNPYNSRKSDLPKNVAQLAAKWGISWGGDFKHTPDPMHFEFTGKIPSQGPDIKLADNG